MELFKVKLKFLCQRIGYAVGVLRGTGVTLEECDPVRAAVIKTSQLAEDWPLLLNELTESYGAWKDISALDPLMKRVEAIELSYEFKHSTPSQGQIRMDVLFRDYLE